MTTTTNDRVNRLRRAALWWAQDMGIPVFRLQPGSKRPLKGSHAELDGTRDPAVIEAWWSGNVPWNIGASLRGSDRFVLDVDPRAGGDDLLADLESQYGELPHTTQVLSGGGGVHYWFLRPPELESVKCRMLAVGLDLKGLRAGYVALPPSTHSSGREYTIDAVRDHRFVASPPSWLVELIQRLGKVRELASHFENEVDPKSFWLGAMFSEMGWLGKQIKPGVFSVRCPNAKEHTQGKDFDGSTVIYSSDRPGFHGAIVCLHSHCTQLTEELSPLAVSAMLRESKKP